MKRNFLWIGAFFFALMSFHPEPKEDVNLVVTKPKETSFNKLDKGFSPKNKAEDVYQFLKFEDEVLSFDAFEKAFQGFQNLKESGKLNSDAHLLTICDFSLSSNKKRLWVIDTNDKKILFNSLVAHGKGTGEEFANQFSNIENSRQSSLGFYITDETYEGENGYSLKLIGVDNGFNDAALKRYIVMHGADYVSEEFIKKEKRLGRSWGCPAVPRELAEAIIDAIKNQTCLFIYYPDQGYLSKSEWLRTTN